MPSGNAIDFDQAGTRRQIERAQKKLRKKADEVLQAVEPFLQDRIVQLAPHDTGVLEAHVFVAFVDGGKGGPSLKCGVSALVYPVYVEFGTKYMRARPFFRPAIAEVEVHIRAKAR